MTLSNSQIRNPKSLYLSHIRDIEFEWRGTGHQEHEINLGICGVSKLALDC